MGVYHNVVSKYVNADIGMAGIAAAAADTPMNARNSRLLIFF